MNYKKLTTCIAIKQNFVLKLSFQNGCTDAIAILAIVKPTQERSVVIYQIYYTGILPQDNIKPELASSCLVMLTLHFNV